MTPYVLYLNSVDKISGTNNNATYNVNWSAFLPYGVQQYKINFNFLSNGGQYKDVANYYASAKIYCDFIASSNSYDSSTGCISKLIGLVSRDIQSSTSSSNTFSCFYGQNAPKTINAPTQNVFSISIYNTASNTLLVDTTATGNATVDMTAYMLIISFDPI
jgi:hypothetical protein